MISAAALAAIVATPGHAFLSANDHIVLPDAPDGFTIPYRGQSGAPAFWCAASDYARHALGADPTTRLYRTSGPRRAGEGVRFSLSPEGARSTGLFLLVSDGPGLSVAHAEMLCDEPPFGE